jgi:tellurite resistance protein TerC
MAIPWLILATILFLLVILDLLVVHRARQVQHPVRAFATAAIYLGVAVAFAFSLHWAYGTHWYELGCYPDGSVHTDGEAAALQFLTALLLALALDLDSILVICAIFGQFQTPVRLQRRVLLWGVLVAICTRGLLAGSFGLLLMSFEWVRFILAGLLVLAALRMLLVRQEAADPSRNVLVRLITRFFPVTKRLHGSNFFTMDNGRAAVTPLLLTLVVIELADALFALDSVPAVLSVTREPFIVVAAMAFALLISRSLYPALSLLTDWIRYVKVGLAVLLLYSAVKISLPEHTPIPVWSSFLVVTGCVLVGIFFALLARRQDQRASSTISPLGEDADRLARATLRHTRRVIVLVVGGTTLAIGAFMMIGPGPGIPIFFIALALLGTEFAWARRLMERSKGVAIGAARTTAEAARRRFKPWILIPKIGLTMAFFASLPFWTPMPIYGAVLAALPVLFGQAFWGWLAFGGGDRYFASAAEAPGPTVAAGVSTGSSTDTTSTPTAAANAGASAPAGPGGQPRSGSASQPPPDPAVG